MPLGDHLDWLSKGNLRPNFNVKRIHLESFRAEARWRGWKLRDILKGMRGCGRKTWFSWMRGGVGRKKVTIVKGVPRTQEGHKPFSGLSSNSTGVRANSLRRLGTWYHVFGVSPKGEKPSSGIKCHPRERVRMGLVKRNIQGLRDCGWGYLRPHCTIEGARRSTDFPWTRVCLH